MGEFDWMLYSQGKYWLFEHWNESATNIYSKSKYANQAEFVKGAGKILSEEQINTLLGGVDISIKQEDGTTLFFKYVDL